MLYKIDISKEGELSKYYGMFYRFAVKHYPEKMKTDEDWQEMIHDAQFVSEIPESVPYRKLFLRFATNYLSWQEYASYRRGHFNGITVDATNFQKMLIAFWNITCSFLTHSRTMNDDIDKFETVWKSETFSEDLICALVDFAKNDFEYNF